MNNIMLMKQGVTPVIPPTTFINIDWLPGIPFADSSLQSALDFGNGKFVHGGYTKVAHAISGDIWTVVNGVTSGAIFHVVYTGGKFIAGGSQFIAVSNDGISWTQYSTTPTTNYYSSAFGNGVYVVAGNGGFARSTDSINWSYISQPIGFTGNYNHIAFGNGKFVTVQYGTNKALYSTDGITWTGVILPTGNYYGIAFGNGKFVISGNSKALYSTDGITWTVVIPIPGAAWNMVKFLHSQFIMIGSGSQVRHSVDGITWGVINNPYPAGGFGNEWNMLAYKPIEDVWLIGGYISALDAYRLYNGLSAY